MAYAGNFYAILITFLACYLTAVNGITSRSEDGPSGVPNPILKRVSESLNTVPPSSAEWDAAHGNHTTPPHPVAPVNVTVNMYLRQIKLDPAKMELHSDTTLRAMWIDRRLSWDPEKHPEFGKYISLTAKEAHNIWIPDLFFPNEKSAHLHQITTPNQLVRIYPDGKVYMSSRILMTTFCRLDFHWFPFDNQTCTLDLASYGLTNEHINLQWDRNGIAFREPITLNLEGTTGKYITTSFQVGEEDEVVYTRSYRKLWVRLGLRRENYGALVWRYFLPTSILVCISWLTFWIRPTKIAARLLIGLVALLGVYHLQVSSGLEPSAATSTTVFDIWGALCGLIVVVSLVETVAVHYLALRAATLVTKVTSTEEIVHHQPDTATLLGADRRRCDKHFFVSPHSSMLDRICLIVLPAAFFVASAVFFGICL